MKRVNAHICLRPFVSAPYMQSWTRQSIYNLVPTREQSDSAPQQGAEHVHEKAGYLLQGALEGGHAALQGLLQRLRPQAIPAWHHPETQHHA